MFIPLPVTSYSVVISTYRTLKSLNDMSYFSSCYECPHVGSMWKTWSFFSKLIHPWFIFGAVVRCYSVMFAVKYLKEWLQRDVSCESSFQSSLFD